MYQRDYILRVFEQLVQVLAAIFRLKRSGQYQEALIAVDQALQQLLGFSLTDADTLPAEQLVTLVRLTPQRLPSDTTIAERLIALATLLQEAADVSLTDISAELKQRRQVKAMQIYLAVLLEDDPDSARAAAAVAALATEVTADALPPSLKDRLWRYAEQTGQFATAEDWLFALLADAPDSDELIQRGIAFYQRLCDRSDAELEAGRLPREEVLAGLAELRGMLPDRE